MAKYLHCRSCVEERPPGRSMEKFARIVVFTSHNGLVLWCTRHNRVIANITPEGLKKLLTTEPECDLCKQGMPH